MFLLMFTVRSTTAWSSVSHFKSTLDWKQNTAPTFHAWWNKSTAPGQKGKGADRIKDSVDGNDDDDLLTVSSSSTTPSEPEEEVPSFFIRPVLSADIGPASKILADGFFKDNTNFFTYQLERFETYLSLEVGFPRPNTRHEIFVACEQSTGKVLGLAEVDARTERPTVDSDGPYLCNVAVDLDHLRQGIATALVEKCEAQVQEWVTQESKEADILNDNKKNKDDDTPRLLSSSLHLKVRQSNEKAVNMYQKLGYQSILQESDKKKKNETILIMRKQLERCKTKTKDEVQVMEGSSVTG